VVTAGSVASAACSIEATAVIAVAITAVADVATAAATATDRAPPDPSLFRLPRHPPARCPAIAKATAKGRVPA
jgi:hypothetical protein